MNSNNLKGFFVINNIQYNYQHEFTGDLPQNRGKQYISLLEYCLNATIHVPHYCYHKQLSIAGNCRMCLVELKKSPKPIVSCAMNAQSTLKMNAEIFTNSPLVKKARENIMEFLLLNHPLDCPICDQGGECDLQDQSLFFGLTKKRFYNYKRVVTDKYLGPIVKTVMTRCIHCTRCVRFATEIAGVEELGVFGRGINSEIGTYINKTFQSELSGNIIDLCPVGALTSKPYPFAGRNWELKRIKTIDLSDGYGLNIQVFLKNNVIVKVLPGYDNLDTNNPSIWISDKTRFLFDSISSHNNVNILTNTSSKETDDLLWYNIFTKLVITIYLYDHLQRHVLRVNHFIVMFDESSSVEVISILLLLEKKYSFFQLKRTLKLKITNDFQSSFQINALRHSNMLSSSNMCLLLNTNTRYESPYLNLKLKKRYSAGNFRTFSISCLLYTSPSPRDV
jgi:NADH dehydrogenase/NADH:ubiquinone oxidoreductase subunit G